MTDHPHMTGDLFDDEANDFFTARFGWVSRRDWDADIEHDEWIFMPPVGWHYHPIRVECDGYGFVAYGASDEPAQDSLTSQRQRFYSVTDLKDAIGDIEKWEY